MADKDPNKSLMDFLFPALNSTRTEADSSLDQLAFRRPLITLLRLSGIPTPALPALSDRDLLIKLGVSIRDHKISEIISDMEQVRQM
jgi:hypothetical protein